MNVTLSPNSNKMDKKIKMLYILIAIICLIAILISAYMLVYKNDRNVKKEKSISEETYFLMESEFENIFTNETINQIGKNILITNKIKEEDEIIGISYQSEEKQAGKYSLNVKVPYININTPTVKEYNTQIEQIFKQKAIDVISSSESKDIIYTVDYVAYVNEKNILSIVIRSILKEGSNAQRTIIQTYNYDFQNNKEIKLEAILKTKDLEEEKVEKKIIQKIKQEQSKVEELKKLGYNIFERDYTNEMYDIKNTTEFFLGKDNFLYLIYAYGNENYTSELDMVIF